MEEEMEKEIGWHIWKRISYNERKEIANWFLEEYKEYSPECKWFKQPTRLSDVFAAEVVIWDNVYHLRWDEVIVNKDEISRLMNDLISKHSENGWK